MHRYKNVERNSVVHSSNNPRSWDVLGDRRKNPRSWDELGDRRKLARKKEKEEKEKADAIKDAVRFNYGDYVKESSWHPYYERMEYRFECYKWKPIVPFSGKDTLPEHIRAISRRTMKKRKDVLIFVQLESGKNFRIRICTHNIRTCTHIIRVIYGMFLHVI